MMAKYVEAGRKIKKINKKYVKNQTFEQVIDCMTHVGSIPCWKILPYKI